MGVRLRNATFASVLLFGVPPAACPGQSVTVNSLRRQKSQCNDVSRSPRLWPGRQSALERELIKTLIVPTHSQTVKTECSGSLGFTRWATKEEEEEEVEETDDEEADHVGKELFSTPKRLSHGRTAPRRVSRRAVQTPPHTSHSQIWAF